MRQTDLSAPRQIQSEAVSNTASEPEFVSCESTRLLFCPLAAPIAQSPFAIKEASRANRGRLSLRPWLPIATTETAAV